MDNNAMDEVIGSFTENNVLDKTDKATERELLRIQSYKRYSVYQALLEIHPQNGLSVKGCMQKAVLYILKWMKDKVGVDDDNMWPEELRSIPDVNDWADYVIEENSPISDINIKEPVRIRTLYWDKCWTLRFNESNSNFDGEFENNISITIEDSTLVLGINTECRQTIDASQKAIALRPGYVSKMIMDKDMYLTEKLCDGPNEDILKLPIVEEAISINGNGVDAEKLYGYISNPMRNFPIIFIPKPENEEEKKLAVNLYHDGDSLNTSNNKVDHHGVLGYYSTIYLDGKWNKFLYSSKENTSIREWIRNVVTTGRVVMIAPWDGTVESFKYFLWEGEGDYILWNEDSSIEDCPRFDEYTVNQIKKLKLSQEPVERRCNFGNYRFNRVLWNDWNQVQIDTAKREGDQNSFIANQSKKNEHAEKDKEIWKEKYNDAICKIDTLHEENQFLRKKNKLLEGKKEDTIINNRTVTEQDYQERLDILKENLKKEKQKCVCLFPSRPEWENVYSVLKSHLLNSIYEKYKFLFGARKKTDNPTRREDVLGILYCFNDPKADLIKNTGNDVLLYYPKNDEIYENEYKNLILDAIWDDNDKFVESIASDVDYDKRWREYKKNRLLDDIDNYRQVKSIKPVLNQEGIFETSNNKHNKWCLGGDERYTYSIATTPGDVNTGKNTVDGFMEKFF